jgi:hypothetical protein
MKKLTWGLAVLLLGTTTPAKPKGKIYPASCDRVWDAVKRATAPPNYNFAQLDDAQKKGVVFTGSTLADRGRELDITLSGSGNTCTVWVAGSFSGLAHNDKGDLFKRIDASLGSR